MRRQPGNRDAAPDVMGHMRTRAPFGTRAVSARPAVLAFLAVLIVSACGAGAGSTGSVPANQEASGASPTAAAGTPVASLPADAIQHPTGSDDVILRAAQSGGFVRMDSLMARVPVFTLYGDGRALIMPVDAPVAGGPKGGIPGAIVPGTPLREVRLDEEAVQEILTYAITSGRLGTAKPSYEAQVMDLPTTIFEIHTGDLDRNVSVGGLGAEPLPGPDAVAYRAFSSLLDKLRAIGTTGEFVPEAFVAVLAETEPDPAAPAATWPWPDLEPSAFTPPADTDPIPFPKHDLTAEQVAALGVEMGPGGASGFRLQGPDGKTYVVAIRPSLPEEIGAA